MSYIVAKSSLALLFPGSLSTKTHSLTRRIGRKYKDIRIMRLGSSSESGIVVYIGTVVLVLRNY